MLYLLAAISVAIIAAAILMYRQSRRKSRPAAMLEIGTRLDLTYTEKDNSILENLKFFKIYDATTLQAAAHNVLRSRTRPPDFWIFDYQAVVGLRNTSGRVEQTVFYWSDPRMKLPGFRLIPAGADIGKRSDAVFKYRPIVFQSNPQFMANFRLISPDEQDIRTIFKPDLIAYLEKLKDICVEGFGNELFMYRYKTLVHEKSFNRFFQNAKSIFQLFLQNSMTSDTDKTGLSSNA
jgi:hypothetical protein